MKKGISVVINVKNEEENIKECIDSVKEIANEIIVADMQSTDRTVKIAKKFGAKVFSVPDYGYADPARNFSHKKASFEWILSLDADERLSFNLRKTIKKIVSSDKYDVVYFPFKNIHFGKWIKHTGWWPDYKPKLFRKNYLFWYPEVHSQPKVKGRILKLPAKSVNAIIHFNTKNIAQFLEKNNRYTDYSLSFKNIKEPTGPFIIDFIENEFWYRYITEKGYEDGIHGYVLSKFMEYYRFLEFVKDWEKKGYKEIKEDGKLYEILRDRYERGAKTREMLEKITSSKTFRIWQMVVNIRRKVFNFLGLKHE